MFISRPRQSQYQDILALDMSCETLCDFRYDWDGEHCGYRGIHEKESGKKFCCAHMDEDPKVFTFEWYWINKVRAADTITFHEFGGLPIELQMKVWQFASLSDDQYHFISRLTDTLRQMALFEGGLLSLDTNSGIYHGQGGVPYSHPFGWLEHNHRVRHVIGPRSTLFATCHLARQMALEAWQRNMDNTRFRRPWPVAKVEEPKKDMFTFIDRRVA